MPLSPRGLALALLAVVLAPSARGDEGRHVLAWPPTKYARAEIVAWRQAVSSEPCSVRVTARGLDVVVAVPELFAVRVVLPPGARCSEGVDACAIEVVRVAGTAALEVMLQSPDTSGAADTLLLTAHDTMRAPAPREAGLRHVVLAAPNPSVIEFPDALTFVSIVPVTWPARVTTGASGCAPALMTDLAPGQVLTLACAGDFADLTGLSVSSDVPSLVFSGNAVTQAPIDPGSGQSADLVLDAMPPLDDLGPVAWLACPLPRSAATAGDGDLVRFVAGVALSVRVRDDAGGDATETLAAGEWRDLDSRSIGSDRALLIESAGSVLAWQIPKSRVLRGLGDPAAIPLLALHALAPRARAFLPDGYGEANVIVVAAPVGGSVTLDGAPVTLGNLAPGGQFAWGVIAVAPPAPVTGSVHELECAEGLAAAVVAFGGYKAHGAAVTPLSIPRTRVLRGSDPSVLAEIARTRTRSHVDPGLGRLLYYSVDEDPATLLATPCGGAVCLSW